MGGCTGPVGIHLTFNKLPLEKGKKLHKYSVFNTKFGVDIGIIHWRGGWRQYVFRSHDDVDMSKSCHNEVNTFIDKLMKEWREKKWKLKKR